jgi:hypothetical protein
MTGCVVVSMMMSLTIRSLEQRQARDSIDCLQETDLFASLDFFPSTTAESIFYYLQYL